MARRPSALFEKIAAKGAKKAPPPALAGPQIHDLLDRRDIGLELTVGRGVFLEVAERLDPGVRVADDAKAQDSQHDEEGDRSGERD